MQPAWPALCWLRFRWLLQKRKARTCSRGQGRVGSAGVMGLATAASDAFMGSAWKQAARLRGQCGGSGYRAR